MITSFLITICITFNAICNVEGSSTGHGRTALKNIEQQLATDSFGGFIAAEGYIENNKAILKWQVKDNLDTYLFEIEKSEDGKKFKLAGIVFGTDKMDENTYLFYEKSSKKKIFYRIHLVNNNKITQETRLITIHP